MKRFSTGILLISFIITSCYAQVVKEDLFNQPTKIISNLPLAADIDIDDEGNILLIDPVQSQVFKFLKSSNYDSSIVIGGKNGREEGFLSLKKIVVKNRQNLYLLDDADRRIILLNTNLKIIGNTNFLDLNNNSNSFEDDEEIYPISFDISIAGEQYILNQQNNKVYKFNPFGKLENTFGGLDYGAGSLLEPVEVILSKDNFVYLTDTTNQQLTVFDNYGVYRYKLKPLSSFKWQGLVIVGPLLICYNHQFIHTENLQSGKYISYTPKVDGKIIDLKVKGEFIYLLLENAVHLYRI